MEFMPLSKRINNLHINNTLMFDNLSAQRSIPQGEWGPGPPLPLNLPETPPDSVQSLDWNQYSPELTESENPYYYNINKLLFEMYLERQQRLQQTN